MNKETAERVTLIKTASPKKRRVRDAGKTGAHCADCGASFKKGQIVYRRAIYLRPEVSLMGGANWMVVFCERCNDGFIKNTEPKEVWKKLILEEANGSRRLLDDRIDARFLGPLPCEGCGRLVRHQSDSSPLRRRACSADCVNRARNVRARHCRTAARAGQRCQLCGAPFDPGRSGAKFCNPTCRQQACRQRRTRGHGDVIGDGARSKREAV